MTVNLGREWEGAAELALLSPSTQYFHEIEVKHQRSFKIRQLQRQYQGCCYHCGLCKSRAWSITLCL